MHIHPVDVRVKNPTKLLEADEKFFGLGGGLTGSERCLKFIKRFLKKARIFADQPISGHPTAVTVDFKQIKIASRADTKRPLTVLKVNGVALMFLRPDQEKDEGILFKICPHDHVGLIGHQQFALEVSRFNATIPISEMKAEDEEEKEVA